MQEAQKIINRSRLADSLKPSWNKTITDRAKNRIAVFVLLAEVVHKKMTCDINRKEAIKE
ncbi:hypothetical protein ACFLYN_01710 [Chloroflexota bacterium]